MQTARRELHKKVRRREEAPVTVGRALLDEIGQRKRIEAIEQQQRGQRTAASASWVWDVRTDELTWSGDFHEIFGLEPRELGGTLQGLLARLHPEDQAVVRETVAEAARTGAGFRADGRIVRPDGELRHVQTCGQAIKDQAGATVQVVGICYDVTAEREAVAALRESERTLRRLIDGAHDYAICLLDSDGRIVSWNSGATRILQYARDEVLERDFSLFHTDDDRAQGFPAETLAVAARDGRYEGEGWRVRKDGTRLWASVVIDAVRDEDGALVGFAKITRDITEKREAQIALEQARDQLAQAQKMESIGQLTGGVAHDFNNLLTVVIGNLEILRRLLDQEWPDTARMRRIVASALRGAQRGASLTQQLLAFSRSQPLEPRPLRLDLLLSRISDLLRRTLGEDITISTALPDDIWRVEADPNQLENAVLNLVVNARDAMPGGGELAIEATNLELDRSYPSEGELRPGQYVVLTVSDTGTGMTPEVLARVFEPFFTTKEVGRGTGLGLPQVYGFVKQSGGHVKVYSEPGRGTTVQIYLPRLAGDREAVETAVQSAPDPGSTHHATILLVEDDEDVRAYSNEILAELGYRVLTAAHGREALEAVDRHPEIRLLFTDIGLPGEMNGRALAAEALRRRPDLDVLLTTGYARLASAGGDGLDPDTPLIAKPFTAGALVEKLNAVLARAGGR